MKIICRVLCNNGKAFFINVLIVKAVKAVAAIAVFVIAIAAAVTVTVIYKKRRAVK